MRARPQNYLFLYTLTTLRHYVLIIRRLLSEYSGEYSEHRKGPTAPPQLSHEGRGKESPPTPTPKGGECHAVDLLSGMLFGTVGNAAFCLSQWVGQLLSILFCASFNIVSFLIPRSFPDGCPSRRGRSWWWGFSMFTMFTAMFTPQLSDTQRVVTK